MESKPEIQLLYDRECPACDFYCHRIDVRESKGTLVRVDARGDSDVLRDVTAQGLDIDEGMVLKVGNRLHYGADAINELARLSSGTGLFNRFAGTMFRSPAVARVLYPALKFLRNLLLKMLGRSRINNLGIEGRDRF